jgi:hypothetical protein
MMIEPCLPSGEFFGKQPVALVCRLAADDTRVHREHDGRLPTRHPSFFRIRWWEGEVSLFLSIRKVWSNDVQLRRTRQITVARRTRPLAERLA